MATDIMGLFAPYDPYAAQQKQQAQFQQNLMQSTNPQQFMATVGTQLGSQLGQGLQGMLGGKSPQEQRQALRLEALKEAQASNPQDADQLNRALAAAFNKRGLSAEAAQVMQTVTAKTPVKPKDFGDAREGAAFAKYHKNYAELTQAEANEVEKIVLKGKKDVAGAGAPKGIKDVAGALEGFNKQTEPYRAMYETAGTAINLINEAKASNNEAAWESARTQLAKAVGESKLSNEDIKRMGVSPAVIQGARDWVSKKVTGVPTADMMNKLIVLGKLLQKQAGERINRESTRYGEATKAWLNDTTPSFDILYPSVQVPGQGVLSKLQQAPGASTTQVKTVSWSDLN